MSKNPDKAVALGWCGRWSDGSIGWRASTFIADGCERGGLEFVQDDQDPKYTTFERVRITVEVVRRRDGRRITRKPKGAQS